VTVLAEADIEEELDEIFSQYSGRRDELIPLLQEVQEQFRYLPPEAMQRIARFLRMPESTVFGVASFYAQFRFTPIGKNQVMVCRGTACHVRGAPQILEEVKRQLGIEEGETTPNLEYSLETVACIGCCALAPCFRINGKVEAKATPKRVKEVFAKGDKNEL